MTHNASNKCRNKKHKSTALLSQLYRNPTSIVVFIKKHSKFLLEPYRIVTV